MYNSDKGLEEPICIRIDEINTIKVKHEMTSNPTTQTHYYWLTINGTDFKDYFVTDSDALYEFVSNITGCKILSKEEIAKKIREDKKIEHEVMKRMSQVDTINDIFSGGSIDIFSNGQINPIKWNV
jgi:hypothetical protein